MAALFCDLRPDAALRLSEYRDLAAAGEAVALFWPAAIPAAVLAEPSGLEQVSDGAGLDTCLENEQVALIAGSELPGWVPLQEFHRVLLLSAALDLTPGERGLIRQLLQRGCEAVEVLPPHAVHRLSQSWNSGRRAGATIVRA